MKGKEALSAARRRIEALEIQLAEQERRASEATAVAAERERSLKTRVQSLQNTLTRGVDAAAKDGVARAAEKYKQDLAAVEKQHRERCKAIARVVTSDEGNVLNRIAWDQLATLLHMTPAQLLGMQNESRAIRRVTIGALNETSQDMHEGADKPVQKFKKRAAAP